MNRPGRFALAWSAGHVSFDPHQGPEHLATPFMAPIYDRLIALRPDGALTPMLAEAWWFDRSGDRLTLRLRRGVTLHDGSPLDASVVVATLQRAQSEVAAAVVHEQLRSIVSLRTEGQHLVHLEVGDGAAGLPTVLATAVGMVIGEPQPDEARLRRPRSGSGPFVLAPAGPLPDPIEAGVSYSRAPQPYWASRKSSVDGFLLAVIPDHAARLDALLSGSFDIIDIRGRAVGDGHALAQTGEYQLASYPSTTTVMVQLDRRSEVLADKRVRRAVSMALDRESLLTPFGGQAEAVVQSLPATSPAFDPALERRSRPDMRWARWLVASAGADGRHIRMLQFAATEPMTGVAAAIADRLRAIGLLVDLEAKSPPDLVASWQRGGFDLRTTFASSLPGDVAVLHRRLNAAQSPGLLATFSPRLAELVPHLLDQSCDAETSIAIRRSVNRLMVEDVVVIELGRLHNEVLANRRVLGVDAMPYAILNLFDAPAIDVAEPS